MDNKPYWEAVTYTDSRWGLYGKKVVDHRCGHKHRSEKAAWNCVKNDKEKYVNNVRKVLPTDYDF